MPKDIFVAGFRDILTAEYQKRCEASLSIYEPGDRMFIGTAGDAEYKYANTIVQRIHIDNITFIRETNTLDELLAAKEKGAKQPTVVTSDYHILRATVLANLVFGDAKYVAAHIEKDTADRIALYVGELTSFAINMLRFIGIYSDSVANTVGTLKKQYR